jgi:predicted HTH transcriptional regulator
MTCLELQKILNLGEDSSHQLKEKFNSIDQLAVEISAFANSEGGELIIGASDKGIITGLSRDEMGHLNQWISNATTNKIEPPIFVRTKVLLCKKKRVLVISVPQGNNKPYAVNKTEFWVKNGADKRRATREELLRLMQASHLLYADELDTTATLEDFDIDYFGKYYQQYYDEKLNRIDAETKRVLENIKLAKGELLTLAGLLLFGKKPELIKPQFAITATYYVGEEIASDQFIDSEKIEGKLTEQFRAGVDFVKRNLHKLQAGRNFNAPPIIEIPVEAFAEAIGNAIVHRDYFINSPVFINLLDNRLEIVSPGPLPNTVTEENIKYGIHIERNPTILSFLEKDATFRYSGRGTGIPRMIKKCREADVPIELVNDKEKQQFKVVFHRKELPAVR